MPSFTGGAQNISGAQITDETIANADIATDADIATSKFADGDAIAEAIGEDNVETIEVSLSAANIIALYGSEHTLVPAPGAGKAVVFESATVSFSYGTVQFTGGGDLRFYYAGQTTSLSATPNFADNIQAAADSALSLDNQADAAGGEPLFENTAIILTNVTAAFANGDGTMKVNVRYRTITL